MSVLNSRMFMAPVLYGFVFLLLLFKFDLEGKEQNGVTPYLITMTHDQLFLLDDQLQLPPSNYHRDDTFLSGESNEEKEILWDLAKEEAYHCQNGQELFQEAFQAYFEAQHLIERGDFSTARFLLNQTSLLLQHLWDESSFYEILAERIKGTEIRLQKMKENEGAFAILKEEQAQNLLCYQRFFGIALPVKSIIKGYNDFEKNPYMSPREREAIRPYLMPEDHPVKPTLDSIFQTKRAILNQTTFTEAGFVIKYNQQGSFIKVASHPRMPGYLVKVHLDSTLEKKRGKPSWRWLVNRVEGANKVRKAIEKKKSKFFVVPRKWLYPLPIHPSVPASEEFVRKNVILVVQDMKLVSDEENRHAWQTVMTKEHLDELYAIIKSAKGSSYRPDNIAYTQNGKFAFIDTEYPHRKPNFKTIGNYLSPEMKAYWEKLVKKKKK